MRGRDGRPEGYRHGGAHPPRQGPTGPECPRRTWPLRPGGVREVIFHGDRVSAYASRTPRTPRPGSPARHAPSTARTAVRLVGRSIWSLATSAMDCATPGNCSPLESLELSLDNDQWACPSWSAT
ncbi:hypothetical protein ADK54_31065 [Streptomyces sp. WM6378]|nr:hypothetical protein ADK54_31065 [Streptomyces sp. WM6378]